MKRNAIYFFPDISGFTSFVTETAVEHSRHIIAELLELLLENNVLNLKLAEIEGDALFLYTEDIPSFDRLQAQTELMAEKFYEHLHKYNTQRICDCNACSHASGLQIKFIAHYGQLTFIEVFEYKKPYGLEVIKLHRLTKNSVPFDEYILYSADLINYYRNVENIDADLIEHVDEYDFGSMEYYYKKLNYDISKFKIKGPKISTKPNSELVMSKSIVLDANKNLIYKYISDYRYRLMWYTEVDEIVVDYNKVNRNNLKHICIVEGEEYAFITFRINENNEDIIYGETTNIFGPLKNYHHILTLKDLDDGKVKLTVEIFGDYADDATPELKKQTEIDFHTTWDEKLDKLKDAVIHKREPNLHHA